MKKLYETNAEAAMWGVAKPSKGPAAEFDSFDGMRSAYADPGATLWVDLENPTADELERLDLLIDLDDQALEDCLLGEPRPRIVEFDDCLLLVAYGVRLPDEGAELEARKLTIFRGDRFLVTIHTQPSRSVRHLKERCAKNPGAVLSQGIDRMLYRLIDGMVDRYLALLDEFEEDLEEFEERSLEGGAHKEFLLEAGRIRRRLIEVRRLAVAQRDLLQPLAEGDFDYISDELGRDFRGVRSHLQHASDRVKGLQERLSAAVQTYNASVAKRTNDIVQLLTVMTAVMMPMTLIAGVYGMNLPTWPAGESQANFWLVVAAMGGVGASMLGLFRWLRWL